MALETKSLSPFLWEWTQALGIMRLHSISDAEDHVFLGKFTLTLSDVGDYLPAFCVEMRECCFEMRNYHVSFPPSGQILSRPTEVVLEGKI